MQTVSFQAFPIPHFGMIDSVLVILGGRMRKGKLLLAKDASEERRFGDSSGQKHHGMM